MRALELEVRILSDSLWPNPNGEEQDVTLFARGFDSPRPPHLGSDPAVSYTK